MEDLTKNEYDRLTVEKFSHKVGNRCYWYCKCSCKENSFITVRSDHLKAGSVRSCGCLKIEQNKVNLGKIKHGFARRGKIAPECNVWSHMMRRCYNKDNIRYPDYGGRGIEVCERWHNFANFIQDMGQRPSSKHTIERKDNNGHYCLENCIWATPHTQSRNKRNNIWITINGETKILKDWAIEYQLDYKRLHAIYRSTPFEEFVVELEGEIKHATRGREQLPY